VVGVSVEWRGVSSQNIGGACYSKSEKAALLLQWDLQITYGLLCRQGLLKPESYDFEMLLLIRRRVQGAICVNHRNGVLWGIRPRREQSRVDALIADSCVVRGVRGSILEAETSIVLLIIDCRWLFVRLVLQQILYLVCVNCQLSLFRPIAPGRSYANALLIA